jgi:hypothetical protein
MMAEQPEAVCGKKAGASSFSPDGITRAVSRPFEGGPRKTLTRC